MSDTQFKCGKGHFLRIAQGHEILDALSEERDAKTIDMNTSVTLGMLANILRDPGGLELRAMPTVTIPVEKYAALLACMCDMAELRQSRSLSTKPLEPQPGVAPFPVEKI